MRGAAVLELASGRLALALPLRALVVLGLLLLLLALTGAASLLAGTHGLSAADVLAFLRGDRPEAMAGTVLWEFRFLRMLAAMLTGAMLATSGALLQGLTRSPLADPSPLGAGFATVVVILVPRINIALRPVGGAEPKAA